VRTTSPSAPTPDSKRDAFAGPRAPQDPEAHRSQAWTRTPRGIDTSYSKWSSCSLEQFDDLEGRGLQEYQFGQPPANLAQGRVTCAQRQAVGNLRAIHILESIDLW
jgi:hypothetical protein